ncbi:hypothetical protein BPC006_I2688 [Burkholderia pseudomallei BPC006]|nr:hypothetical protein BPC006_I2688 [Burkholderia pseudomallei BPC006]
MRPRALAPSRPRALAPSRSPLAPSRPRALAHFRPLSRAAREGEAQRTAASPARFVTARKSRPPRRPGLAPPFSRCLCAACASGRLTVFDTQVCAANRYNLKRCARGV